MTTPVERPRILLVDDEPNLLDGLRRQLRRDFTVETAVGAANGLFALKPDDPFAVIVSDFLMPGINGAEFLAAAAKAAPTSTRMLLTGHTSLADAAITVNQGRVFRMLLKPVDTDTMTAALRDCVTQHKLVVSERELLERTLQGSVKALSDVLSLASPAAFGRAARMRRVASAILDRVEVEDRWAAELAVEMAQLGIVALPPTVAAKLDTGAELALAEQQMVDELPAVAEQLISPIPRMAPVADCIHYSRKGFDGSGTPADGVTGDRIPFGGRLLRLVQDHDALLLQGMSPTVALATLRTRSRLYDPALLEAFSSTAAAAAETIRGVMLADLQAGMVLAAAVRNRSDVLLVNAGQEVTVGLITRLRNFAALEDGVAEPLMVLDESGVSAAAEPAPVAIG
ncbi:HD domain-containing phosphohydrolase [Actinoplanes auranticolor]|uniref:Response regulator receiver modulated metal-depenent phosphohydrolase n=1 Tax=Actinoplanes auranticolor TaxID=47988 RepID=A0A919VJ36_9ACTN|nr:HD domain-containing phosphohydrolase [Actinoplanes auranticolor]GIM63937.1 response regulator receiver modulated metal-depenent phosphohydrolase [Actinoplanes auranticolor]